MREGAMPDLPASPAGRGAPPRRGRRVLWGAATAAAVAGAAGVLIVSMPRGADRAVIPGHIGILDRPATESDRLPEWAYGDQMLLEQGIQRDATRLAGSTATRRYYIAPAVGGRVCLVDVPAKAPPMPTATEGFGGGPGLRTGGIQCADTHVFDRRFMIVMVGYGPGGRQLELAGVVPDGYDRATTGTTSVEVRDNLFVMRPAKLTEDGVRLTGPNGERTAYHGFLLGPDEARIPRGLDPTVSVFDRAPEAVDTPPPALRAALDAARSRPGGPDPVPGTERRVAVAGRTSYWLTRDRYRGLTSRALLAMVSGSGVTLRPIVLPTPAQPFRAWPSTAVREPFGPTRITLRTIVPDGFTTAVIGDRSFPVRNNFLLVRNLAVTGTYRVELRGPAGTVVQSSGLGSNEFRIHIPTNSVSSRERSLATLRAVRAGLRRPFSATIVAGLRADIPDVLGRWATTGSTGRSLTIPVVVVRNGNDALVVVIDSAVEPGAVYRERRYRADQVPDLSVLGRVRPLRLD
ncbi:MAG: hypothetical protein U0237_13105 [Thermoleophilia bacterium]